MNIKHNYEITILLLFIFTSTLLAFDMNKDIQILSLDSLLNIPVNTASKYDQKITKAPASISIITAADIENYGFQTLAELLSYISGFYGSNDRNYSYLGVRGFGRPTDYNNRILLLLNGHTLNEDVYAGALLGTETGLSLPSVEHIEIVRGPNSVVYGTGAMLAVINIITKTGKNIDGVQVNTKLGSYGKKETNLLFGRNFSNGLDFTLSGICGDVDGQDLYFKSFDTPENNNGIAKNLDGDRYKGIYLGSSYKGVKIYGFYSDREKDVPTGAWDVTFNDPSAQSRDIRKYIDLSYEKKNINNIISVRCYFDGYKYNQSYPADYYSYEDVSSSWYGVETRYTWDIFSNLRSSFSLEYQNHYNIDYYYGDGEEMYFGGLFKFSVLSGNVQSEYQLNDKINITAGIRGDKRSDNDFLTSPRIGIIYNPSKSIIIKGLFGNAFRSPNVYESNFYEAGYQKVNPGLLPEKITTRELSLEKKLKNNFHGKLSIYHYKMEDLIDFSYSAYDSLYLYDNLGKVKATGAELEFRWIANKNWNGFSSLSYQDATNYITHETLDNSPRYYLVYGMTWERYKKLSMGILFKYETDRISVYKTHNKPHMLTTLNIKSQLINNRLSCSFYIQNLFNVDYSFPGGLEHRMDFIPQNKRNFLLTLTTSF